MKPEEIAKQLADNMRIAITKMAEDLRKDFEFKLNEIKLACQDMISALPVPEKGEKGDKGDDAIVDIGQLKGFINEEISKIQIPQGEKGEKGDPGQVDMEKIWELIVAEFKKVELPQPEKGEKGDPGIVDMEAVQRLIVEEVSKRDTIRILLSDEEIEDGISERRSYSRGTLARHKGGLWRAHERTNGMKGWECIIAGFSDVSIDFNGEREIAVKITKSDGLVEEKKIYVPALLYKDIFKEGESYQKNDVVTLGGSLWLSKNDTKARPGISDDWVCIVKRGGTGKSAYDLARDAGFNGTRQEWLDQIGKKPTVKI